jgi:uncharacterized membrane protein
VRAHYLDALRGLAVVWMIFFHAAYDLKMFNHLDWDFATGFWYAFPRVIAFTFLFCVGVSLNYTHRPRINWTALRKRTATLGAGALAVSVGTYFLFPNQWVYFGTLHCILVGSILGALVANCRPLAWGLLILILAGQYGLGFDIRWVSSVLQRPSMDFIPIYPWFWAILAGLLLGPRLGRVPLLARAGPRPVLSFLGRHSLKIYLLHQPIIFGLIWSYTELVAR